MAKLIILGSSNAVPHKDHENTHMVIVGEERAVLVDCVGNPILRLERAGVDFNFVTDLILTHFHPDHVSGVPLLLMDMWLMGRRRQLNVYGLHATLDKVEALMGFYDWGRWPNFFPTAFIRLPPSDMTPVLACQDFNIFSSPVRHMIPTIGLRVEFSNNKTFAYSCDTEPCEQVIHLAAGADVLIHEAAGPSQGHSSPAQAAEVASQAEVGRLILIHYPNGSFRTADLVSEARARFRGDVVLAEDFMTLEF
ncbi:MAG: MBL fold metallo-hydrolase [Chloroflexota bacterium]